MSDDRSLYSAELETPSDWAADQDELVLRAVLHAAAHAPEVRERLARAGVESAAIGRVADLPAIPVLAKDDLPDLQAAAPPFGGMLAGPVSELKRIYTSPGPILDPEGPGPDHWRMAPALWAAGFRPGHVALNTFSYHLTPGGMMMDAGLREVGCVVIPGGVGNSTAQVELAVATGASGYVGTPQFLVALLERAAEVGAGLGLLRATVTGAPFPPSLRRTVQDEHGVDAFESYGTADAGTLGYECAERAGWHVAPGVVIEIADPATDRPLPAGETGEVVVTSPNPVYPLVRFGTGDLSAFVPESLGGAPCPCGRTTPRLRGFGGRTGEGVKVKGMFVHPRQIARALSAHPGVTRWQAVVTAEAHVDHLTVRVEAGGGELPDPGAMKSALEEAVKLRLEVELVEAGAIPEDARPVADERQASHE